MANFPFKDATFTSYADLSYPILNYGSVYYTKINGRITAVKPIALGIYKKENDPTSGWTKQLSVLAADGKRYNLSMNARRLFLTAADAVAYERSTSPTYYSPIKEKSLDDILRANGACRDWHTLKVYVWNERYGEAYYTDGGYMFWADSDGEHIVFMDKTKAGSKIYLNKVACVNDNVSVMEFTEDLPVPQGEYTVKREFTVKAHSEEEAEGIIDEVINKAYKEQFK